MTDLNAPNRPIDDPVPADLRARVDGLAREIEPERDLWPEIAARLASRSAESERERPRRARRTSGRWFRDALPASGRGAFVQALAALLAMAVGALLFGPGAAERTIATRAVPNEEGATATPASFEPAIGSTGGSLDALEAEYLKARESLWLDVLERRETLSPVTVEIVERNLRILDDAIRELRAALAVDPGDPRLERRLIESHQQSLDLLRRLSREA